MLLFTSPCMCALFYYKEQTLLWFKLYGMLPIRNLQYGFRPAVRFCLFFVSLHDAHHMINMCHFCF